MAVRGGQSKRGTKQLDSSLRLLKFICFNRLTIFNMIASLSLLWINQLFKRCLSSFTNWQKTDIATT